MTHRYIEFDKQGEVLAIHDTWPGFQEGQTPPHKDGYSLQHQVLHKTKGWQAVENFYK